MCKDNSITHLNKLGYNMVRLPRENVCPLLVLSRSNDHLETLGKVSDFVIEAQPKPPRVEKDRPVAELSGLRTDKFELGVGLKFLEKLLSYLGAAGVGLEAKFKDVDSIQFVYQNVLTDSIHPAKIGKYLLSVSPDVNSPFIEDINDEGEAYVITDTLKSNAFGITAYDETGAEVEIDISALKELLSATPKIGLSRDKKDVISFKGDRSLCFAFKAIAVWVEIEGGKASFRLSKPAGPIAPMRALPSTLINPDEPTPVIFGENTLLRLRKQRNS